MKIDSAQRRVQMAPQPTTRTFGIATNSKMFEILYSSLYKRPKDAIVREVTSNIFDAHLLNGYAGPGRLSLPGPLTPVLTFRDFGPGLSDYDVQNLYTTMGASTKEDDEEAIGAFGLGSKTPLAYTDAFTVISRHKGEKRVYTVVKGADKIPILQSDDVVYYDDEPSGLEISVPVKAGDEDNWEEVAIRVLKWFPPESIEVVGFTYGEITPPVFTHETENWAILPPPRSTYAKVPSVVLMGPVTYELDETILPDAPKSRVVFKMPLGAVQPQPSREGLTYDPRTLARMEQALVDFEVEFTSWISEGLEGLSPWDLAIRYRKLRNEWDGFPLPLLSTELNLGADVGYINIREGKRRSKYGNRPLVLTPGTKRAFERITPAESAVVILDDIEDPKKKRISSRLKAHRDQFEGKKEIYIVSNLVDVGDPSRYRLLSEFDTPADHKVKSGAGRRAKRERPMVFDIQAGMKATEALWGDEPAFGSIYVDLSLRTVTTEDWENKVKFVRSLNRAVWGLTKRAKRHYRDDGLVHIDQFIADQLRDLTSDRALKLALARSRAYEAIPSSDHHLLNLVKLASVPAALRTARAALAAPQTHSRLPALSNAVRLGLMAEPKLPKVFDFSAASARICRDYPVYSKMCEFYGFSNPDTSLLTKALKAR